MPHRCTLTETEKTKFEIELEKSNFKGNKHLINLTMVSKKNPLCHLYFKSDASLMNEKIRQLQSGFVYILHPFSMMRHWYEFFQLIIYAFILLIKPIEACANVNKSLHLPLTVQISLYLFSWIDIAATFSSGYFAANRIELRPSKIAKHYVLGPHFFIDLLNSIPLFLFLPKENGVLVGLANKICFLRIARIASLVQLTYRKVSVNGARLKNFAKMLCLIVLTFFLIHYCTYIQLTGTSLFRFDYKPLQFRGRGDADGGTDDKFLWKEYEMLFFKTFAFTFGIGLPEKDFSRVSDDYEYVVGIITYIFGKLLITATWVTIAMCILSKRTLSIKYLENLTEIHEYAKINNIPEQMELKILQCFEFKHQQKFLESHVMTNLLTKSLKKDIYVHMSKTLLSEVSLFQKLTHEQLFSVVQLLKFEIFLPKDTIFLAGTATKSVYFLSSGTVAVYTTSGREMYHLSDGSYFGELPLVLRRRTSLLTTVAVETCYTYRMSTRDFENTLLAYETVREEVFAAAEMRLRKSSKAEQMHKNLMFAQQHNPIRRSFFDRSRRTNSKSNKGSRSIFGWF